MSSSFSQLSAAANSAADGLKQTLGLVRDRGIAVGVEDSNSVGAKKGSTQELLNFGLSISNPRHRLIRLESYKTRLIPSVARFVWMMAGNNRLADIAFYEPRVKAFSDDDLTVPGSDYGMRMLQPRPGLNQLSGVISELRQHPSSRRALVAIYHPEDAARQESKDIPCTFGFDYFVRDGKLLSTTIMRSNNAVSLLPFNLFEFSMLAEVVAVEVGAELGPMSHIALSMHVYDSDFSFADKIIADASTNRIAPMEPMPKDPLKSINRLAQLEAELRHSGHLIGQDIDRWVAKAEELGQYWGQFYLVLLFHVANKIDADSAAAVRSVIPSSFINLLPEATGPVGRAQATDIFAAERPSLQIVALDSRRMKSLRTHIERAENKGRALSAKTIFGLEDRFSRLAARDARDIEISDQEFADALNTIEEVR